MPDFIAHTLDLAQCRSEVEHLRALLGSASLAEVRFREFFQVRPHISALIGLYNPAVVRFDLSAWEYPLFGDFRCDLVIGDSVSRAYAFVELEDAGPRSLFTRRVGKATR